MSKLLRKCSRTSDIRAYNTAPGTVLNAGTYPGLLATFTPSPSIVTNYASVTTAVTLTITRATPKVSVVNLGGSYDSSAHAYPQGFASVTGVGTGSMTPTGSFSYSYSSSSPSYGPTSSAPINAGTYTVTATFTSTNSNYNNAQGTATMTIAKASPFTAVSMAPTTGAVFGQSITVTARLALAVNGLVEFPTGTVTFDNGTTPIGTGTLKSGVATFTTSALTAGSHIIYASYPGDANNYASVINGISLTVNKASTNTVLTAPYSPLYAEVGSSVTLTATVSAVSPGTGSPTGTVTFKEGSQTLGTANVSSGTASLNVSPLALGLIVASYSGDGNFNVSSSNALPVSLAGPGLTDAYFVSATVASLLFRSVPYATSYVYRYSTNNQSTWSGQYPLASTDEVSGLNPALPYQFEVASINGSTQSIWSTAISAPPEYAPTFTATVKSSSEIDISWSSVPSASSGYAIQPTGPTSASDATYNDNGNFPSFTYAAQKLSADTAYTFNVAAANPSGARWGTPLTFTTLPAQPTINAATPESASTVTLTFSGVGTGFVYRYSTDSNFLKNVTTGTWNYDDLGGFTANTRYYFEVAATNASGQSTWSNSASALTFPSAPVGVGAKSVSPNEIDLSFTIPGGYQGLNTEYSVLIEGNTSNPSLNGTWSPPAFFNTANVNGSEIVAGVTTFAPGTSYTLEVGTSNASGNFSWSGVVTATTWPAAPQVTSTSFGYTTELIGSSKQIMDQVNLTWSPVPTATNYLVLENVTQGSRAGQFAIPPVNYSPGIFANPATVGINTSSNPYVAELDVPVNANGYITDPEFQVWALNSNGVGSFVTIDRNGTVLASGNGSPAQISWPTY